MSTHSSKRNGLTLALACVFALLLGVIGWIEFGQQPTAPQIDTAINAITIKRNGHPDIQLVRENDQWRMTAPYTLKANAQRIEPLLTLGTANFASYEQDEVDMAATGLNTPGASVTVGAREFKLGVTDAQGDRRYALVDNKVSFVPEWAWSLIHGGVTAFADLQVFDDLPDNLYLHTGDKVHTLSNADQWKALQADKIVPWPDERNTGSEVLFERTRHSLSPSSNNLSKDALAEVVQFEKDTLINTEPGYAFAISTERMRALMHVQ